MRRLQADGAWSNVFSIFTLDAFVLIGFASGLVNQ
jgi:hypothetical protein